jgi:hypothetical protein
MFLRGALALLLLTAVAACSRSENDPPVASVSVAPTRARITPGGVLDMTFRFEVKPGTVIPLDYTVFVHFVNADGQTLWTDDHAPEVPTSQWKGGQVVQYSRTRFLPTSGLAPGDVTVRVGLYRDDTRLPLEAATGEPSDRAYPVTTLQVGTESDAPFLILTGGWHPEEFSADGTRSWTWTQKAASLSFRNPKSDILVLLEYDARPDVFPGAPQQVTVSLAGQPIATFSADSNDVALKRLPVQASALGTADMVEMTIEVDKVFIPAELPAGGRDSRPLGIRVYHAFVDGR